MERDNSRARARARARASENIREFKWIFVDLILVGTLEVSRGEERK